MIVNVSTAVFSQHPLLRKLGESLERSTRPPDCWWIVDHGYDEAKVHAAVQGAWSGKYRVITLEDPGAARWANWVLTNVHGEKIGCGDDIEFEPDAIEKLIATPGDFVVPRPTLNAFACCLMRDSCIEKVGLFDETISPRYLYFEDCDYGQRMRLAGVPVTFAHDAVVRHVSSATYKAYTPAQMEDHHRRFAIAQANYVKKWGGLPHHETFTVPYDGRTP